MVANKGLIGVEEKRKFSFSENNSHVHWLKEGANYFGRAASNDIFFPGEQVALQAGILFLNTGLDRVLIRVAANQKVLDKNKSVDNIFIYENGSSLILEYASYKFRIIKEGEKTGLLIFR